MSRRNMHDQEAGSPSPLKGCRLLAVTFLPPVFATLLCSPFQALGQWGRSKKPAGDERDQRQTGSRPHSSPARFFDRPHWPRAWNRLAPLESAEHLFFFITILSRVVLIQSQMFPVAPLAPSICLCHLLFGFSPKRVSVCSNNFCLPLVCSQTLHLVSTERFPC